MFASVVNIFKIPELRRKILITLALLAVFRLGAYIPLPGIDTTDIQKISEQFSQAGVGKIMAMASLMTGGRFEQCAIFRSPLVWS